MFDDWRRSVFGDGSAAGGAAKSGVPEAAASSATEAARASTSGDAQHCEAGSVALQQPTATPNRAAPDEDTTETAAGGLLANLAPSGWRLTGSTEPVVPSVPSPTASQGAAPGGDETAPVSAKAPPAAKTEEDAPSWCEIGVAAGSLAGGAIANAARTSVSQLRGTSSSTPASTVAPRTSTSALGAWSTSFMGGGAAAAESAPRSPFRTWFFQSSERSGVLGLVTCFAAWYVASELWGRTQRRTADDPDQSPTATAYLQRVTLPFTPIGRDGSEELASWGRRLGCAYATMHGTAWSLCHWQGYYSTDTTYVLPAATTLGLVRATHEVHSMCLETIDEVVRSATLMDRIGIPQHLHYHVWRSWQAREPDCLGRMDFALDERTGVPKFLEYNADTPTILLESGPLQLSWLDHFARGVRDWHVAPPDMADVLKQSLVPYRHSPEAGERLANAAGITGAGDSRPRWGQLNSIQSNLRDACRRIVEARSKHLQTVQMHFAYHPPDDVELANTVAFVRDAYINAGACASVKCAPVTTLDKIRLKEEEPVVPTADTGRPPSPSTATTVMVDEDGQPITTLVKWYPWEAFSEEEVGSAWYLKHRREKLPYDAADAAAKATVDPLVIEPAWKYVLTSKALLPLLWERYPGHPNLVEAHTSIDRLPDTVGTDWVAKPAFGREGAGVVRSGQKTWNPVRKTADRGGFFVAALSGGDPALGSLVFQRFVPTAVLAGRQAVFGSWVVNGQPSGFAIREDRAGVFTNNNSCFVPHIVDMDHAATALKDTLETLPFRRLATQLRKGLYGGNGGLQVRLTPARTDGRVDVDVAEWHRRGSGGGGIRWGTGGYGGGGGGAGAVGQHPEEKPKSTHKGATAQVDKAAPAKPYGGADPKKLSKPTGSWTSRMQARVSS